MQLDQLIAGTTINPPAQADAALRICDITEDSRTVVPGSLFIARKGHKSDAVDHIPAAVDSGAVAILHRTGATIDPGAHNAVFLPSQDVAQDAAIIAERFFGSPAQSLRLAGVTGTNGKTTVCHFLYQLLNAHRKRAGLIGTVCIDDGIESADATLTTPGALEVSYALSNMRDAGYTHAVIEASSHALVQRRIGALRFTAGVFTNLSGEHLDYHGSMDEYARAKSILFDQLTPDGVAVLNADDPRAQAIARNIQRENMLTCSLQIGTDADCTARVIEHTGNDRTEIELVGPWGTINQSVQFFGQHNLMNCLQAVAAATALGVDPAAIDAALPTLRLPPGRLEHIRLVNHPDSYPRVYVDYAHTDDALENLLASIRPTLQSGGRLRVAFGCGGDRDKEKRPRSAAVVCKYADEITVTVNDAHTESPSSIINDILAGMPKDRRDAAAVHPDRRTAIETTIADAHQSDIVVIAGKGHEKIQYLPDGHGGETQTAFSDAQVARDALRLWTTAHADAEPSA